MIDAGRKETDKLLEGMERKIANVYKQTVKKTEKKLSDYMRQFESADKTWREKVKSGKATEKEYKQWRQEQIMSGRKWQNLLDNVAEDYRIANIEAKKVVKGYIPQMYSVNHSYATYSVEKQIKKDTAYKAYDEAEIKKDVEGKGANKKDRKLLQKALKVGLLITAVQSEKKAKRNKAAKDTAYQKRPIQSATMRSILAGDSIDKIAKQVAKSVGNIDYSTSVRYARTATTSIENAGRMDAFERASDMGINIKKVWVATLDDRVRAAHAELDGQEKDLDEPFVNEIGEIMYPADPNADPANVWNCRCTMISQIKGFERDVSNLDLRNDNKLGHMSYDEWKRVHK